MTSRFVILHHRLAGGEHWDLMLEHGESLATWQLLARLGCDQCQGFFSARPMPREELSVWHESWLARLPTLIRR